jgi:hypothetical protein
VHRPEPHQLHAELLDLMDAEIDTSTRDSIRGMFTPDLEAGWRLLHDSPDPFERDLARSIERELQYRHPRALVHDYDGHPTGGEWPTDGE